VSRARPGTRPTYLLTCDRPQTLPPTDGGLRCKVRTSPDSAATARPVELRARGEGSERGRDGRVPSGSGASPSAEGTGDARDRATCPEQHGGATCSLAAVPSPFTPGRG
jgi:hypothetical protein